MMANLSIFKLYKSITVVGQQNVREDEDGNEREIRVVLESHGGSWRPLGTEKELPWYRTSTVADTAPASKFDDNTTVTTLSVDPASEAVTVMSVETCKTEATSAVEGRVAQ